METLEVSTYLPIFSGFYGTIWDVSDEADEDYDYKSYERDVIIELTEAIKYDLISIVGDLDIEVVEIIRPAFYNYRNDSVNIEVSLSKEAFYRIIIYLYKYKEAFASYLEERYTSYSGFISHYSNKFNDWERDTEEFTDWNIDAHRLGSVLNFILLNEERTELDYYYNVETHWEEYATEEEDEY